MQLLTFILIVLCFNFQDIPGCGKFKKLGLQNEDDLQRCFGDIVSVGVDHWSPHMAKTAAEGSQRGETQEAAREPLFDFTQDDTQAEEGDTNDVEESSPVNPNKKRAPRAVQDKGKKPKVSAALTIQDAVTSMATSANSYACSKLGIFTIEEVMNQVIACGANYDSDEHFIATELFVKKEQREMFMTMPMESRFSWLTRKYKTKYGN